MKIYLFTLILGFLLLSSCYKESDYSVSNAGQNASSLTVYVDPPIIAADSFSFSRIIVELPYDSDSSKTSVQLTTDLGVFTSNHSQQIIFTATQNSDSLKRIGIVLLKSGTMTGTAHIQCTLLTLTRNLADSFTNAFPTALQLTASVLGIKPKNDSDGEVSFVCQLTRQNGYPSQRNVVIMKVVDTLGNAIGSFRVYNNMSDGNGQTQFTYVLGDSIANGVNYTGKLTTTATVSAGPNLPPITQSIQIISSP